MRDPVDLLSSRITELDTAPLWWQASESQKALGDGRRVCLWITHFTSVMSSHTNTFMDYETGSNAMIDPVVADEMTSNSRLVDDIASCAPSLSVGPLQANRQHWTQTGGQALLSGDILVPPSEEAFVTPALDSKQKPDVKPFGLGLYTSTATSAGCSMWRALLGPNSSMLYPGPWYTWELEVERDLRVAEIVNAMKWVEFVCTYARVSNGLIYPDWERVAQEFDAVHVTLPTIVAAQGFHFDTPRGVIPPAFWDVETTLWLRWCFSGARLVESVPAMPEEG